MRAQLRGRMARWMRKRQGEDTLPVTLARRRLYILPTGVGAGAGVLLLLMLLAGLNYANSIALFVTFLLIGFVLVSMHQCHRNLLGMRVASASVAPTFATRDGTLDVILDNVAASPRLRVMAGLDGGSACAIDLPARGRGSILLSVPAPRRGLLRLERLQLLTRHPFGLFRAWTWVHAPIEMLVYPRPRGRLPMPEPSGGSPGLRPLTLPGQEEWLGLRPFREGDSPRQIDWKAYAREAPLLVKEYSSIASTLRTFDFRGLAALDTEARLEQLARWIVDAESAGERYGLSLPGTEIAPDRGSAHRHRCLAALALFSHSEAPRGEGSA